MFFDVIFPNAHHVAKQAQREVAVLGGLVLEEQIKCYRVLSCLGVEK